MAEEGHEGIRQIAWSASLRVAHPSKAVSKKLRGDKILLPQSALEQLLAASTTTTTNDLGSSHTFTAFDPGNPYSVAAARQERAQFRTTSTSTDQQLPHPLTFRLVNPSNGNVVYTGIREFSADKNEVVLSTYLMEALGVQEGDIKDMKHNTPQEGGRTEDDPIRIEDDDGDGGAAREDSMRITIHARQLPKGTYVRLRPLEAGYNPEDWKALLERQLRDTHTTLTKGSILSVHGGKEGEFRFLVDRFRPDGAEAVCVVDTDLEVDIEALNEEQARETLKKIAARMQRAPGTAGGNSVGGPIDIWKAVDGQVVAGEYVDYELASWDRARPLALELSGLGGDDGEGVDLLVSPRSARQRVLPRMAEHVWADFGLTTGGVKRIVMQPTNVELEGAESLLVSIHGYGGTDSIPGIIPRPFTLRARSFVTEGSSVGMAMDVDGSAEAETHGPDEEQCQNCFQWVPKRTMVLHESFCRRNNVVCPQCKTVFQKTSQEWQDHWHCPHNDNGCGNTPSSKAKHDLIFHTPHTCPSDGACPSLSPFPSLLALARHRTTTCPSKLILCQFCHLEVPQEGDPADAASEAEMVITGLTAHERADGARTTDCHLCGAIVRLRDMSAHQAHHALDRVRRPPPRVCRNVLCSRTLHGAGPRGQLDAGTRMGQGPGNELGLCSMCFAPLYAPVNDPDGRALRRRIERRYLTQLLTGCGRKHCDNEWCRTGRGNRELEPRGTNAAACLREVKPLAEAVPDHAAAMWFCVEETRQARRAMAEMLAAEGVYRLEWCIAAVEAEAGDLGRAREWLANWAPTTAEAASAATRG